MARTRTSSTAKPIDVAVIGLGRSGWNIHAAQLRADKRYRIVSVFDLQKERLAQAHDELGCQTYRDYDELLKQTPAKLVVIATPSMFHCPQTLAAFKADKHVVVEKPMSATVKDADRMIGAASKARKKLFVHQNYRWKADHAFIRQTLESKKLGKLFQIAYCRHGFSRRDDWQTLLKNAGGLLANHVSHPLDFTLSLTHSTVADVLADMKHISDAGDAEDHVNLLLRTKNGIAIHMDLSTAAATPHHAPEWTFLGTTGAMTVDSGQATLKYFDPKKVKPIRVRQSMAVMDRRYGNDDELPWQEQTIEAKVANAGDFYDSVYDTLRNRKKFPIDPREVREMMRVFDICRDQNPKFRPRTTKRSTTKPRRRK